MGGCLVASYILDTEAEVVYGGELNCLGDMIGVGCVYNIVGRAAKCARAVNGIRSGPIRLQAWYETSLVVLIQLKVGVL